MVRYSCSACGAGVDLPMPALPGQNVACPSCRRDMVQLTPSQSESPPKRTTARPIRWSFKTQIYVLGCIVALFWAIVIVDVFVPADHSLCHLGIHPHAVSSLVNIFFAPFLHNGFAHVFANTVLFVPLGWLIMVRSPSQFLLVSLISTIVSGLGIWVFGTVGSTHVGASGVIFGYLGFLLTWGYFERSVKAFLLAVVVTILFGGVLWGVLPLDSRVSWQGHLFGFVGGATSAWLLSGRNPVTVGSSPPMAR